MRLRGATWADYQRALELRGERGASHLDQLVSFVDRPSTSRAIRDYRAALQRP